MGAELDPERARASKEATDWLILLQDDPDDADLRDGFAAWLAQSPLHVHAWEITRRASSLLAQLPPAHEAQWRPVVAQTRRHPVLRHRIWAAAASLAAAACLAVALLPDLRADYVTGTGETRAVRLSDGTLVELAPRSALAVANGGREARLLSGEAFFSVVHDPDHPFRVAAGDVEATDIGTAFDVRRGRNDIVVAVKEGSVQVTRDKGPGEFSETLIGGQGLRASSSAAPRREDSPPSLTGDWRDGRLVARDEPMEEVVDRLRPYFAGKIMIADSQLARSPVTGAYKTSDPAEALHAIARARGARILSVTPWLLVVLPG